MTKRNARTLAGLLGGLVLAAALPFAALAQSADALVGEWVATDEAGTEMLVMTLAEDGTLTMAFDGSAETVGTWQLVDGKLQLIDEAYPDQVLLCDWTIEEPMLLIHGEGECSVAPPFTRRS